jgi:hypothetical protein
MLTLYAIKNNNSDQYFKNAKGKVTTYMCIRDASILISRLCSFHPDLRREDFSVVILQEVGEVK